MFPFHCQVHISGNVAPINDVLIFIAVVRQSLTRWQFLSFVFFYGAVSVDDVNMLTSFSAF
jgi:hypothetical protein